MPSGDHFDDLFGAFTDDSPLAQLEDDMLDQMTLPASDIAIDRLTDRLADSLPVRRPIVRPVWIALAASAALAAGLWMMRPQPPVEGVVAVPAPVEEPAPRSPEESVPAAPESPHREVVALVEEEQLAEAADRFDALRAAGLQGTPLLQATVSLHGAMRRVEDPALQQRLLESVEDGYDTWLQGDDLDEARALEVRYAFAEMLYKAERFEEAYEHYTVVAGSESSRAAFCAMSAVYSARKASEASPAPITDGERELTRWEQNLVAASDRYRELDPTASGVIGVQYQAAYVLYTASQFDASAARFEVLIREHPGSREATMAANLILDGLILQERWEDAEQQALSLAESLSSEEMTLIAAHAAWEVRRDTADGGLSWLADYADVDAELTATVRAATVELLREDGRDDEADALVP